MFDARIITGCWEDGIIELSGMPEDFILSNRTVVVAEKEEFAKLQAEVKRLRDKEIANNNLISLLEKQVKRAEQALKENEK